jgi:hypothetical protein
MTFSAGHYYQICDVCGFKLLSNKIKKRWDGLMVCAQDYEQDHPQKFVRVLSDGKAVPEPRPEPADTFTPWLCYLYGQHSYADMAEADCVQADKQLLSYLKCKELRGY